MHPFTDVIDWNIDSTVLFPFCLSRLQFCNIKKVKKVVSQANKSYSDLPKLEQNKMYDPNVLFPFPFGGLEEKV